MRTKIFLFQVLITSVISLTVAGVILVTPLASAETKTTTKTSSQTTTKAKTEDIKTQSDAVAATEPVVIPEKAQGAWNSVQSFFLATYAKIDAWRVSQLAVWNGIKTEKETQIAVLVSTNDDKRSERVDKVLDGENVTMFEGSGSELQGNGNVFLLKLYSFVLFLFIIIFSTPIIFYGIAIFLVLTIISRIINKIRHPEGY